MKRSGIHNHDDTPHNSSPHSKAPFVDKPMPGYHPTIAVSTAYSGTFCMFLLGNILPNLPPVPYPGCLLPTNETPEITNSLTKNQIILTLLFTFHFCRRTFETIFVHRYNRSNTLFELVGTHIYYWFFAFWAGWSIRADMGYIPTYTPLFAAGVIVFSIGEVGNCAVHLKLRDLRKGKVSKSSAPSGRRFPQGAMFALVSCPHYLFEILSWVGFAMASMVLASMALLTATVVVLLIMSMEHHRRYLKDFDGKDGRELYPQNRKALLPYIY